MRINVFAVTMLVAALIHECPVQAVLLEKSHDSSASSSSRYTKLTEADRYIKQAEAEA